MGLILQEVSTEREIEIPDPVRNLYKQYRPSPLVRALRLEKALDTPAHIYYKNESVSPAGSHKPNTAIPQAFYNKEEGIKRIATETGAGQWGSALAYAGAMFGIEVKVYMVRASYDQKPYRRLMMETYGASVVASPSMETAAGRAILAEHPNSTGSLGMAISEAVEDAVKRDDTHYALGSVLNHVMLHQTIIGLESIKQMEMAGEEPDIIIACAGGGSNFAGLAFPWLGQTFRGGRKYQSHRGGAGSGSEHDPRALRVRLRRHGQDGARGQDVHPRPRLRTGADPRRRPPIPRHVAAGQPAQARGLHRGPQRASAPLLRGGHPVRPNRRADPGA
jgi:tryptophan synthase beta chain